MLEIKYFFIRSRLIEMYFLCQLDRTVLMWTVKLTEFYNYGKPCIYICMSRAQAKINIEVLHLHATCLGKDKYLGA